MKTSTIIWIAVVIAILFGGWYWWSSMQSQTAMSDESAMQPSTDMGGSTGSPQASSGQVQEPMADGQEDPVIGNNFSLGVIADDMELRSYLVGYNDMAVYTYAKDTGRESTCYDTCAENWPPYIVSPVDDIQKTPIKLSGTIATTVRADGQLQLTYNGHPLYFYIKDANSGDTTGEGVGGVWHVAKP